MASKILVKDLMSTDLDKIKFVNYTTVDVIVKAMSYNDKNFVMVEQSGIPTGIITTRDIIVRMLTQGLDPSSKIAREIYTNPLVVIEQTETVEKAAQLMQDWNIKHLPVTNKGKLVGMITWLDIAFNVPSLLPAMKKLYKP
jgi:CBS domain-containing protein